MSVSENLSIPVAPEQETYPTLSFHTVATELGAFDDPDIAERYDVCVTILIEEEVSYEQNLLALVRACHEANPEQRSEKQILGIAFCVAAIHAQTGRDVHCLHELHVIKEYLLDPETKDKRLLPYVDQALHAYSARLAPVSSRLLHN